MPVVRLSTQLEKRRRRRPTDPNDPQLDSEETHALAAEVVQQVEGLTVLLSERRCQPHNRPGIGPGGIGDELSQMVVVSRGELVLDDQDTVVGEIASE